MSIPVMEALSVRSCPFRCVLVHSCYYTHLKALYTGDVSPKFLDTRYRVENPGKFWLTLHIAIKGMDKRVYQTFVF